MKEFIFRLALSSFAVSFASALNTDILYHRIAVILMMTVFFVQTFSSCFILADYYTNTQAFARECINKARPGLHCNGKCQMRKQIGNEEKKEQQAPERKDNKSEVAIAAPLSQSLIIPSFTETLFIYPSLATDKESKMPRLLLRPPIV